MFFVFPSRPRIFIPRFSLFSPSALFSISALSEPFPPAPAEYYPLNLFPYFSLRPSSLSSSPLLEPPCPPECVFPMHFVFVSVNLEMNSYEGLKLDLRLCSSIRHLSFRGQFFFADCISSIPLAVHLGFICFKSSDFPVIFPTSYRQSSSLSPLLHRSASLHRAKPRVRGNASRSCQVVLDFRRRAGRRGMGVGRAKNLDPVGETAVERATSQASLAGPNEERLNLSLFTRGFVRR